MCAIYQECHMSLIIDVISRKTSVKQTLIILATSRLLFMSLPWCRFMLRLCRCALRP